MLTGGLVRPELQCRMGGGDDRRRVVVELAVESRNGAVPGSWTPWIGAGCSCGAGERVSVTGA